MDWNLRSFVPKVHLNEFDHKVQCMCACALWPLLVEESSSNDLLHAGLKIWILSLQGHSENRAQDVPERANGGWGGNKDMERATNNPSMELFHDTIALYPTKGLEEYTRFLVTTNVLSAMDKPQNHKSEPLRQRNGRAVRYFLFGFLRLSRSVVCSIWGTNLDGES